MHATLAATKFPRQPSRAEKMRVSSFNAARQIFHATCRAKHNHTRRAKHNHTRRATKSEIFLKRLIFDGENRPKRQNFPQTAPRDNFRHNRPILKAFKTI